MEIDATIEDGNFLINANGINIAIPEAVILQAIMSDLKNTDYSSTQDSFLEEIVRKFSSVSPDKLMSFLLGEISLKEKRYGKDDFYDFHLECKKNCKSGNTGFVLTAEYAQ